MQNIDPKTLAEYRLFAATLQDPKMIPGELIPAYHRWAFANFMARRAQELEMLAAQALTENPADPDSGQRWKFYQTQRIAAHKDAAASERAFFEQRKRSSFIFFTSLGDESDDEGFKLDEDPDGFPDEDGPSGLPN